MIEEKLQTIVSLIRKNGGDPDREFFYLGGPMTSIPQFNFPRFRYVAGVLRDKKYNIVSPAELDDPETESASLASESGEHNEVGEYEAFLGRDLVICALPTCVGMICLEGWHNSRGARGESWLITYLNKQLFEYHEVGNAPSLLAIDRDERLAELGVPNYAAGSVPKDEPGRLTKEANDATIAAIRKSISEYNERPDLANGLVRDDSLGPFRKMMEGQMQFEDAGGWY